MKPEDMLVDELYKQYQKNGFITEDELLDKCDEYDISFSKTDYVTNLLISKGVLIVDKPLDKKIELSSDTKIGSTEENIIKIDAETNDNDVYYYFYENYPSMKNYILQIKQFSLLSDGSIHELVIQAQNGNTYARDTLIKKYMKSALRVAYSYRKKTIISLEDIFSVAIEGVIEGISKYQWQENGYLASYLSNWMRQKIDRYIYDNQSLVRIPVHVCKCQYRNVGF